MRRLAPGRRSPGAGNRPRRRAASARPAEGCRAPSAARAPRIRPPAARRRGRKDGTRPLAQASCSRVVMLA
ncbi:MAG: hypothetical protein FJ381_05800 [Verrucomicrobia bacterium]|nr:hypothetical protein [Verrucomicrobiota bacterium]